MVSKILDIQQMQKDMFPKKFVETLNLFSQPELRGKKRDGITFTLTATSHDQSNLGKPPLSGNSKNRFDFGDCKLLELAVIYVL